MGESSEKPTYSFVIPIYNEITGFGELHSRMSALLGKLDASAEVILVDDGSSDGSYAKMVELHNTDGRFKVIHLSRNFGHQIAVTAGLDNAIGDAVIIMDADLQDPPELVLEMAEKWRAGYEVVYAVRKQRQGEGFFKKVTAAIFYRLMRKLAQIDIPLNTGDFRLVDRTVVDAICSMPESSRFLRGMFAWAGFKQIGVEFDRPERFAGETKYPLRKMLRLAADGIFSFSSIPLKWVLQLGVFVAGISFIYGVVAIITRFGPFSSQPGWASLVVLITFLGGVQLIALGIIGQYMGRVFDEVRRRPLYFISKSHGIGEDTKKL